MTGSSLHVLRCLSDGEFHSGAALARDLNVSRGTVWNAVRDLEAAGLDVYRVPGRGYRLAHAVSLLDPHAIAQHAGDASARLAIDVVDITASTNTLLAERAAAGAASGTVIAAERQERGRYTSMEDLKRRVKPPLDALDWIKEAITIDPTPSVVALVGPCRRVIRSGSLARPKEPTRLNTPPTKHAVLGDITCDSDGKIDLFIGWREPKRALEHARKAVALAARVGNDRLELEGSRRVAQVEQRQCAHVTARVPLGRAEAAAEEALRLSQSAGHACLRGDTRSRRHQMISRILAIGGVAAMLLVWTSKPDLGRVSSSWINEHSSDRNDRS